MTIATAVSSQTTPAAVEFALLQSWLASGSALQLCLHEIERQQQARGREVQRLLLQAHLQQRGNGDPGPVLYLRQQDGELLIPDLGGWVPCSHHRVWNRRVVVIFYVNAQARPASFLWTGRHSACPFVLPRTPAAPAIKQPCRILSSILSTP